MIMTYLVAHTLQSTSGTLEQKPQCFNHVHVHHLELSMNVIMFIAVLSIGAGTDADIGTPVCEGCLNVYSFQKEEIGLLSNLIIA